MSRMVLDGGGLVTLDGQFQRGIYYANSCQESFGWLSGRCDLEVRPAITFKDVTFVRGNASSAPAAGWEDLWGGGAIAMRGGRLTLQHVTIRDSVCMTAHSDGGGGGLRVTGQQIPARVYRSTFTNNSCANGGSISSLGAPLRLVQTDISNSIATGHGASPSGTERLARCRFSRKEDSKSCAFIHFSSMVRGTSISCRRVSTSWPRRKSP